jgi:hypothetical protein
MFPSALRLGTLVFLVLSAFAAFFGPIAATSSSQVVKAGASSVYDNGE